MRGRGPAPGAPNAGRPPNAWRQRLQTLADREEVYDALQRIIVAGESHPDWRWAVQFLYDRTGRTPAATLVGGGAAVIIVEGGPTGFERGA